MINALDEVWPKRLIRGARPNGNDLISLENLRASKNSSDQSFENEKTDSMINDLDAGYRC